MRVFFPFLLAAATTVLAACTPQDEAKHNTDLVVAPSLNRAEAFFDIRAKNIGPGWAQGLLRYWYGHRYYPSQAAEAGESGAVTIMLVVDRLGYVRSTELRKSSGSAWLDTAAVSIWRDAQLPPLPTENQDATINIPLTINYRLIR